MQRRRSFLALVLLAVFFGGGVLAPASHFVYMALADTMGMEMHPHHAAACHEIGDPDEAKVASTMPAHEPCEYAALLANLMAGTLSFSAPSLAPTLKVSQVLLRADLVFTPSLSSFSIRGPPHASVLL